MLIIFRCYKRDFIIAIACHNISTILTLRCIFRNKVLNFCYCPKACTCNPRQRSAKWFSNNRGKKRNRSIDCSHIPLYVSSGNLFIVFIISIRASRSIIGIIRNILCIWRFGIFFLDCSIFLILYCNCRANASTYCQKSAKNQCKKSFTSNPSIQISSNIDFAFLV